MSIGGGMQIRHVSVHNFRSYADVEFDLHDYTILVGANNAGKSTLINALRTFYEDQKWSPSDFPIGGDPNDDAWIELTFHLEEGEHESLPDKYKNSKRLLRIRRYFKSESRVKPNQSNAYAYLPDGMLEDTLFLGAKNVSQGKFGSIIFIPALSLPDDQLKTSGPSPLRNILTFIMKRVVAGSRAYTALQNAFDELNHEATERDGLLSTLSQPLNEALAPWEIGINLSLRAVSAEDITKNLIQHSFRDDAFGEADLPLAHFGHGFQRSVIYELLRIAPTFTEPPQEKSRKEFSPNFTLILFEEPEAFLHPDQQVNLSLSLRQIAKERDQQVLLTTHSPVFVGKSAHTLQCIVRTFKASRESELRQLTPESLEQFFGEGRRLTTALKEFVEDQSIPDAAKKAARNMIAQAPNEEISEAEERFRFQLWLDGDRSHLFFAGHAVVCEGPSETALLNYMLENEWLDLRSKKISVVNALGKFNVHRFQALLHAFSIPYSVMIDGDQEREHHAAVNALIVKICEEHDRPAPLIFPVDLEDFLGLKKPPGNRNDLKPVAVLKAVSEGAVSSQRLAELRKQLENMLAHSIGA